MSNGVPDRPTFETIEAYVLERMSAADRAAFEQRLTTDPALRAELDLEREHILAVELGGLQHTLKAIGEVELQKGGGPAWGGLLKYAAGIALLLGAALWWMLRPPANERLFAEHFSPDPGLPVAMSVTDDPVFAEAMVTYKEGRYAEARARWETLLQRKPESDTLRYYTASAFLAEGEHRAAIRLLEPLAVDPSTAFRQKARWYLFLAYLRAGEATKAMALPVEEDPLRGEQARAIKHELNKR
jgi:tetratricopeptide (TPR) repeat protein